MNRKKWINHLRTIDFARDRKVAWDNLSEPKVAWETFKRLASQFGIEDGIKKAKKIVDKQSKRA